MTEEQNSTSQQINENSLNQIENVALVKKATIQDLFFAGFWMRFWAYLLDILVIASINRLIVKPVFRIADISIQGDSLFSPYTIAGAVIFYLYFILMTKYFHATIGKMVFGLKVISLKEEKLSWSTILFREGIGRYISSFLKILYILIAFTPSKQGLHDIFADTTVIHERSLKPFHPKPTF